MSLKRFTVKNSSAEDVVLEIDGDFVKNLVGPAVITQMRDFLLEVKDFNCASEDSDDSIYQKPLDAITMVCNLFDEGIKDYKKFVKDSVNSVFFPEGMLEFLDEIREETPEFEPQYRYLSDKFELILKRVYRLSRLPEAIDDSERIFSEMFDNISSGRVPATIYNPEVDKAIIVTDSVAIENLVKAVIKKYAKKEIKHSCHQLREWILERQSEDSLARADADAAARQEELRVGFLAREEAMRSEFLVREEEVKRQSLLEAQTELKKHKTAVLELSTGVITVDIPSHSVAPVANEAVGAEKKLINLK